MRFAVHWPISMPVLRKIRSTGGWCIIPVHYTADPTKNASWMAQERAKYRAAGASEADWRREQEIDFSAQAGTVAYSGYRETLHKVPRIALVKGLPLCLWMDFNVAPMVWGVAQIVHGWVNCLRTFALSPATIARMCVEFRNLYPSHNADLRIYGDATGTHRDHQTGQSDYDLVTLGLEGYSAPIDLRVPLDNPDEKDRLNAVNARFMPPDGQPGIRINCERRPDDGKMACQELIDDLEQVVLDARGKVAKTYDGKNPYSKLTHASDGLGYFLSREFPVMQIIKSHVAPAKPLKYGRILGEL